MDAQKEIKKVGFTVDAGLIQRLGYELVGRAETAVSELIKNSYDADATVVDVDFIDSNEIGGKLFISDNGAGMSESQLINGFMRISSTDKVHNPTSARLHRTKAGKKVLVDSRLNDWEKNWLLLHKLKNLKVLSGLKLIGMSIR